MRRATPRRCLRRGRTSRLRTSARRRARRGSAGDAGARTGSFAAGAAPAWRRGPLADPRNGALSAGWGSARFGRRIPRVGLGCRAVSAWRASLFRSRTALFLLVMFAPWFGRGAPLCSVGRVDHVARCGSRSASPDGSCVIAIRRLRRRSSGLTCRSDTAAHLDPRELQAVGEDVDLDPQRATWSTRPTEESGAPRPTKGEHGRAKRARSGF